MKRLLVLAFALVFVVACGKKGEEAKDEAKKAEKTEEGAGLDEGQKFALEGITDNLGEVKALLEEGKPEDTTFKCAAAEGYAETLAGIEADNVKTALTELNDICGFKAPLATAQQAGDKINEALKADPETKFPSECAPLSTALDTIGDAHKDKDEVKALVELNQKVCN